jgi:hypothetical protein
VVCVVPGKRTAENTEALVRGFHRRTAGRLMGLITLDEYAPYRGAIPEAYGETVTPPPGRPDVGDGRGAQKSWSRDDGAGSTLVL